MNIKYNRRKSVLEIVPTEETESSFVKSILVIVYYSILYIQFSICLLFIFICVISRVRTVFIFDQENRLDMEGNIACKKMFDKGKIQIWEYT